MWGLDLLNTIERALMPFLFPYRCMYELRIRFIRAKLRNICYYWNYDESLGEIRERKQYLHVLRTFRQQCQELVGKGGEDVFLKEVISLIDPKVTKDEVRETIMKLENYVRKERETTGQTREK